jgi:hypothetical protein
MWKKLKNLFKRKPKEKQETKTLNQVLKKIPARANETIEETRARVKANKKITLARRGEM